MRGPGESFCKARVPSLCKSTTGTGIDTQKTFAARKGQEYRFRKSRTGEPCDYSRAAHP